MSLTIEQFRDKFEELAGKVETLSQLETMLEKAKDMAGGPLSLKAIEAVIKAKLMQLYAEYFEVDSQFMK